MDQPSLKIDPEVDAMLSLMQQLSPERRREVISAAAQNRFIDILNSCQAKTLGEFVRVLEGDVHWALLQQLTVADLIAPTEADATPMALPEPPPLPAPAADKLPTHLSVVQPPRAHAEAKAPAKSPKRAGDVLDDIVQLLGKEPGLRSEQIQKRLGKPKLLVNPSLAALRKTRRVRTEGENRAMRYFVR